MVRKTYSVTVEIIVEGTNNAEDAVAVQEASMQELAELWVTDALDAYAHYHPGARQRGSYRIAR